MKILFISHFYYPHVGGVEKHVEELSKRLIEQGHEITIVTEKLEKTEEKETIDGIKVFRIPYPKIKFLGLLAIWFWFLKNYNLASQSDLVHCHDVFIWYLPLCFLFPKKPVYTTFHGYEGSEPPTRKAIFWHKLSEKLSWGNICIGDFHKKWYGVKPTFISYGGVDKVKISESKNQKAIFIGRLAKDTGILTYLKALAKLKNISLEVFGDGPQQAGAKNLAIKLKLDCQFHGFVKGADRKLSSFRFAFVSRYLAILEAMIRKRLVFAVFDSKIKEDYLKMAPFAKWIVIEEGPDKLAEKIRYFLDHPEKEKELVEKTYNWAEKQTWGKLVDTYLKLWQLK